MKHLLLPIFLLAAPATRAQSFYDLFQIQEVKVYFAFSDWDYRLDTAKAGTESYQKADSVVVNGTVFKNCGVKYKGNSSYDPARAKNPFHIKLDFTENSDYQGFTDIKLGNGWSDNSMIREPLCYAILGQYMDAPQGNFAKLYINDTYYGLMNNAEDIDKSFLLKRFYSSKYPFVKCNPASIGTGLGNGPNLAYLGTNISDYANKYELKSDTGWNQLIELCDTLNNHFDAFAQIADIDRMLWMLAFNNALVNLDSYTGSFRQNYYLYRDHNRQWLPIVWDLNMCMGGFSIAGGIAGALTTANMPTMNHTLHKSETGWPLINKLLNEPFYSKMYLAHLRTINNENFAGGQFKPLATALHNLVDSEVQNDPNYLSTYANFQASLTANTPGSNGAGSSPGIFPLMDARAGYLSNVLSAAPPLISDISVSNANGFGAMATIQAKVLNGANAYLGYRYHKSERFLRVPLYDDGAHGDGAAGDQVYGAMIPLLSASVQYYIYAENSNTGAFSPERAEHEFYFIDVPMPAAGPGQVLINEVAVSNSSGIENEKGKTKGWVELYNTSSQALRLSGLYLSNKPGTLDKWPFPAGSFIAPQEHLLVWTDKLDADLLELHSNFDLNKSGDQLLLSNGITVFDSLSFGAQTSDRSLSRCPDGSGPFQLTTAPTPKAANVCVSSANSPDAAPWLRISPNPSSGIVRIETAEPVAAVQVFSAEGRLVGVFRGADIDLSGAVPGVYWVRVVLGDGRIGMRRVLRVAQ